MLPGFHGGSYDNAVLPAVTSHALPGAQRAAAIHSPAQRSTRPFKGADHAGGDPATVKDARLRLHHLAVNGARVHPPGVERDHVTERFEAGRRLRVGPARALGHRSRATLHGEVGGGALELAVASAWRKLESARRERCSGQVVDGRVARLEHTKRLARLSDDGTAQPDDDVLAGGLDPRRSRVVPDGFLALGGRHTLHPDHATRQVMGDRPLPGDALQGD